MIFFKILGLSMLILFSFFSPVTATDTAPRHTIENKLGVDINVGEFWTVSHPAKLQSYHLPVKNGDRVTIDKIGKSKLLVTNIGSGEKVIIDVDVGEYWTSDQLNGRGVLDQNK